MTNKALLITALLSLAATLPAAEPGTEKPDANGKPAEKQTIHITSSNGFEYDLQQGSAVYTGNVKVEDPSMRLTCHQLTVKFKPKQKAGPSNKGGQKPAPAPAKAPQSDAPSGIPLVTGDFGGEIESILATGSVTILNKKDGSRATGEQAIYTTANETIVLSGGRPTITSGDNGLRADRVIFERRRGKFRAEGRIESYLVGASLFDATTRPPLSTGPRPKMTPR